MNRKITFLALTLALAGSLCACSGTTSAPDTENSPAVTPNVVARGDDNRGTGTGTQGATGTGTSGTQGTTGMGTSGAQGTTGTGTNGTQSDYTAYGADGGLLQGVGDMGRGVMNGAGNMVEGVGNGIQNAAQ